MKIIYKVVNKAGNDVSFDFDTKVEAENYIKSKPEQELSIKEKKSMSLIDGLLIGLGIISYKFFGFPGAISLLVGAVLFQYLKKKYNIYLSAFLAILGGSITLFVLLSIVIGIFFPEYLD